MEHLVIIDLKTTGLALGSKEKNQVRKYLKELREQGYLKKEPCVDGFVLGDKIEFGGNESTTHGHDVKITPMLFDTILIRAGKRLLNLLSKVKAAPFFVEQQATSKRFLEPVVIVQADLVELESIKAKKFLHELDKGRSHPFST